MWFAINLFGPEYVSVVQMCVCLEMLSTHHCFVMLNFQQNILIIYIDICILICFLIRLCFGCLVWLYIGFSDPLPFYFILFFCEEVTLH